MDEMRSRTSQFMKRNLSYQIKLAKKFKETWETQNACNMLTCLEWPILVLLSNTRMPQSRSQF